VSTDNNHIPSSESRAWKEIRVISIRPTNHDSSVRAYADVRLESDIGSIILHGLSLVQQNGKPPWVGFPQKPGKNAGKYFPVVEVDGKLRELIIAAVLDAFTELKIA
jgi:DNA-binding cell septation regulator SpoVG